MNRLYYIKGLVFILLITALLIMTATAETLTISGRVIDESGAPIIGASVLLKSGLNLIDGTATDTSGNFAINPPSNFSAESVLEISSIGYFKDSVNLDLSTGIDEIVKSLKRNPLKLHTISVSPRKNETAASVAFSKIKIDKISKHSLVPTNPISAIKQPQVTREGSSHSSKLRIYGTSPKYFINNMEIGYDPNHYGIFSIIPASVIGEVKFHAQGTGAEFALPSVIELNTPRRFTKHFGGELNLSSVEATGTFSIASDKYFLSGSLRKSVLDKLVNKLEINTDRMTIPPTNFQDVFLSSGFKISSSSRILVDHYQVRDFLSYITGSSMQNAAGIDTYQHTREEFYSAQFETVSQKLMFRIGGAIKTNFEQYYAKPNESISNNGLRVNLKSKRKQYQLNFDSRSFWGSTQLIAGAELSYTSYRDVNLSQKDWNFLPPDASSDNPYLYQKELNEAFANYHKNDTELSSAGFASIKNKYGRVEMENGLRLAYFGNLADRTMILLRNDLEWTVSDNSKIRLYYGTFAESPVNRILEPYQVLTYDGLSNLAPIKTKLASLQYSHGPVQLGVFRKWIKNLPVDTPNFAAAKSDSLPGAEFITMKSSGAAIFTGGDITLTLDKFVMPHTDLYAYYSYSVSDKYISGLRMPYELDATHKLFLRLNNKLSGTISVGGELAVRSGYPYTPTRSADTYFDENRYTHDYFITELSRENSECFPTHITINLYTDFDFGRTELYVSVSNLTNHDNPIINASDGYIYDAGILPTIGLKYSF